VPPEGKPATIAPSLQRIKRGVGTNSSSSKAVNGFEETNGVVRKAPYPFDTEAEPDNPTVVPAKLLEKFHFTFLIRDPHSSIASYYRCTIPPLDDVTGFYEFYPAEAGYDEVRRVFDYLRKIGHVGPRLNGSSVKDGNGQVNGSKYGGVDICVLDADDLLDNPTGIIEAYCNSVGIKYEPEMLSWDSDEHQTFAKEVFEKWKGFHEDAIDSKELKPRMHVRHHLLNCQMTTYFYTSCPIAPANHGRRKKPKARPYGTWSGRRSMVSRQLRSSETLSTRTWRISNT
jgi:Sulfotransferase domain